MLCLRLERLTPNFDFCFFSPVLFISLPSCIEYRKLNYILINKSIYGRIYQICRACTKLFHEPASYWAKILFRAFGKSMCFLSILETLERYDFPKILQSKDENQTMMIWGNNKMWSHLSLSLSQTSLPKLKERKFRFRLFCLFQPTKRLLVWTFNTQHLLCNHTRTAVGTRTSSLISWELRAGLV